MLQNNFTAKFNNKSQLKTCNKISIETTLLFRFSNQLRCKNVKQIMFNNYDIYYLHN